MTKYMDRLLGTQIGQYQIEALVSSGAIGTVYQGIDTQDGRSVCLKLVHPHMANDPNFRRRLTEAANSLGRLRHKFIVRFHELLEQNNQLFLVSDWVQGDTLAQLSQRLPVGLSLAVNLVSQAAGILADAHRQGFVHGNLHPNNILLKSDVGESPWRVMLTDFLLSPLPEWEPPAANLPYLAPEIAEGKRADGRSDVYALGVILFQLATGRPPFEPASLTDVVNSHVPSPRNWQPDIPEGLERIILKAAARKMTDRYRSMEELALALRRDIGRLPQEAPPTNYATPSPPEVNYPPSQPPPPPPQPAFSPVEPVTSEMGYVMISRPGEKPGYFQLEKWLVTVGQMPGNDLVLPGEGVDDKHARLEHHTGEGWGIVDVGSRSGTYLEDSRLLIDVWQPFQPGQKIRIGPYTLEWRSQTAVPQAAPQYTAPPPTPVGPPIAPKKQGVALSLKPTRLNVVPGNPTGQVLELENQSNRTTYVTLGVTGIPEAWVAMEANRVRLVSQQKAVVPLSIQPPRDSSARAGLHTYQITATPQDMGQETAVAQGQLTMASFSQFSVDIQPSALHHQKAAEVVLVNEGNMPDRYLMSAEDQAREAVFELPQSQIEMAPGDSQTFTIRAVGRKRPFFLQTKVLPFELRVRSEERSGLARGLLLVPPLISLLIAAILVGVLILLAIVAGGFLMCRSSSIRDQLGLCQVTLAAVETETPTPEPTIITTTPVIVDTLVVDVTPLPGEIQTTVITETVTIFTPTPTAPPQPTNSEIIGESVNKIPIEAFRFGNGPNVIVFVGGIHAGFAPSSVQLANDTITHFRADASTIPTSVTLYIIPNLNPDSPPVPGDVNGRLNAHGVNLNRNWDCNWEARADSGDSPLSEPESQALNDFVNRVKPVAVVMWNVPSNPDIRGLVSPGQCEEDTSDSPTPSETLAEVYAGAAAGFAPDQADPDITGDVTNYLAGQGFPAVFVLLDDFTQASLEDHLPAIQAVMENAVAP